MDLPFEFKAHLKNIGQKLSQEKDVLVVSHHDADGITSCAITVDLLQSIGVDVEYKCIKQLDSSTVESIREFGPRKIVFTDMGSGQLELLGKHGFTDYYIIDHHVPIAKYPLQANPHDFGFDGGSDISGAGMAYLVAKYLGHEENAHLSVVGAVGDMQDSKGKLESLNRIALSDGQIQETILVENDLRMFGRQSRSLSQMIGFSSDPLIPGITGDQQAAAKFVQDQGISLMNDFGEYRSYVELDPNERQTLASAIYMKLLDSNIPEYIIQSMVGEVYTLLKEEFKSELRDAKEFATVLNACGRQEESELGVKVCLGDRGASWSKAQSMLEKHRRNLRQGIELLIENGVEKMENLYYFEGGDLIKESIIGVVAGMAYGARIIPPDKPILAFAVDRDDNTKVKVSSRANWGLIRRGIHLGNALRAASEKLGGEGGGHDIAAGAKIPMDKQDLFLKDIDAIFKSQISG